jgi:hypothetical protein
MKLVIKLPPCRLVVPFKMPPIGASIVVRRVVPCDTQRPVFARARRVTAKARIVKLNPQRGARLVEIGHATVKDGVISISRRTVAVLARQEVERVGKEMAAERGLIYVPSEPGEYVTGRLAGVANLASGRFAMIEDGLGFQLVP